MRIKLATTHSLYLSYFMQQYFKAKSNLRSHLVEFFHSTDDWVEAHEV